MIRILTVLFAVLALPARAAGPSLEPLSAAVTALRGTHDADSERDAGPELTAIKRLYRATVETALADFPQQGDPDALIKRLNAKLEAAGLFCPDTPSQLCSEPDEPYAENGRGYLSEVRISYLDGGRYLLVETGVGVRCGDDTSVYVYGWHDKGWHLLLQSEQDDYGKDAYRPQSVLSVSVSPSHAGLDKDAPPPLVMTLGYSPWCSSFWQEVYVRLWRVVPGEPSPKPLVDQRDTVYIGNDRIAGGRVEGDDAWAEYEGAGADIDLFTRTHVLHYRAPPGGEAKRLAPVAFSPRDFVDEWLGRPWSESGAWVADGTDKEGAARTYAAIHAGADGVVLGSFDGSATRCSADPTLWQVAFAPSGKDGRDYHFLVRWLAPYRFSLLLVRERKFPRCDVKDDVADDPAQVFSLP